MVHKDSVRSQEASVVKSGTPGHTQERTIEEVLGYHFRCGSLLYAALTHSSVGRVRGVPSAYERLEYLGDAVLELVVSAELYNLYPQADEGVLTKMRAALVSRRHLGTLGGQLRLGSRISMSSALESAGGRTANSVLANTFEAVLGAVMLDGGYEAARDVSLRLLAKSLRNIPPPGMDNPKGELQELLQGLNGYAPEYIVEQVREFPPYFVATAHWTDKLIGTGTGTGKRRAEQQAAADALTHRSRFLPPAERGEEGKGEMGG